MALQYWLRLDQSAAANCDENIMLVTTAGFRQMWCPEHVEGGSRGRMWGGQQNDASEERGPGLWLASTCSFLQAGPRIWGHWRQSIERGKQGRFGQKQIYLDRKFWDFDFVLECLRTALWCLYCGWWQSGSAEVENLQIGKPSLWWWFMMMLEVGKIKIITSYTWHNFCH